MKGEEYNPPAMSPEATVVPMQGKPMEVVAQPAMAPQATAPPTGLAPQQPMMAAAPQQPMMAAAPAQPSAYRCW